ncbi:MAG: M28 family peptidase [Verrucomicrobiales bacterium]|nr:M28 family peptidase [Verrucomicrobiales bacterium]
MMDAGKVIRFCLVGLPAGLILITAASFIYTEWFMPRQAKRPDARERQFAQMMRKEVNRKDLESYVRVLAEDIGERHTGELESLQAAAFFIESSLGASNMGYRVQRQKYTAGEQEVWNLEVTVPGNGKSEEVVVIGAHYDTVAGSPGADDNASGVAALLSLANAFIGTENGRTLKFVAFVNEESPWARSDEMGSLVYAKALKSKGVKVVAMISLDSLGYFSDEPDSQKHPEGSPLAAKKVANFLLAVGNEASAFLVNGAKAPFQAKSDITLQTLVAKEGDLHAGRSDHWSFWQQGYPAAMITDSGPFRYAEYHQAGDQMEQIDFDRLEEAVKGIEGIVKNLANP